MQFVVSTASDVGAAVASGLSATVSAVRLPILDGI